MLHAERQQLERELINLIRLGQWTWLGSKAKQWLLRSFAVDHLLFIITRLAFRIVYYSQIFTHHYHEELRSDLSVQRECMYNVMAYQFNR